jgi:hypothetical protein
MTPLSPLLKLIESSSTPPRAPSPLHALSLAAHSLLSRSAANPTAVDHQPSLGKRDVTETLALPRRPHLHALSREEEGMRAIRSESDGGIPFWPRQARAGRQIWASLARIRRLSPFCVFSVILFFLFANPC